MYNGDWLVRLSRLVRQARPAGSWRVPANVWGLGLTSFLTDVSSEMIVSILPAYLVVSGGLTPLLLGVATGLHEGGPVLASWIGGLIADRSGQRKLTAFSGYAISAASRLGWLALSTPRPAAIASLVIGDRAGKSLRTAPRDAMISLSVPPAQLATAFGIHRAMDAAGAALGPLVAFALIWRLPRRYDVIFFASFVLAVLGVFALILLVNENPERRSRPRQASSRFWLDGLTALGDPPIRRISLLATALGVVTISDAFIYLLIVQRAHAGAQWIPLLYTGTALSLLAVAIPIGRFADVIGRRRVFVAGHALLLPVYAMAFGNFPIWPWNAAATVLLLGVFYAASEGVLAGMAGAAIPTELRSIGMAWVATSLSAGRLCSALMFGLIWTRAGDFIAVTSFGIALAMVLAVVATMRPTAETAIDA